MNRFPLSVDYTVMSDELETLTKLEYLTAWRTWRVWMSESGPSLHSVSTSAALGAWMPCEAMEARCGYLEMNPPACACDSCPGDDTLCDIYAYKEAPITVRHEMGMVGQVALWGTVIEHDIGFRGQYAYPLSFTHGYCPWCGSTSQPKLVPLDQAMVLVPETGEDWLGWVCSKHADKAMAQATAMDTGTQPKGWAVKPGLDVAIVIAALYQVAIQT